MAAQPAPAADPYHLLLDRIRAGDPEALVELYDARAAAVYSLALALTGSTAAATETTYDAFMRLWAQRDTAENTEAPPDPIAEVSDALLLALSLNRAARANGSAAGLHPQQRLALAVTSAGGRTIRETARILGLNYSTVLRQLGGGAHRA